MHWYADQSVCLLLWFRKCPSKFMWQFTVAKLWDQPMFNHREMDLKDVVYIHNINVFSHKRYTREWHYIVFRKMDTAGNDHMKWIKPEGQNCFRRTTVTCCLSFVVSRFYAVTQNHVCMHKTEVDVGLSRGTKVRKRKGWGRGRKYVQCTIYSCMKNILMELNEKLKENLHAGHLIPRRTLVVPCDGAQWEGPPSRGLLLLNGWTLVIKPTAAGTCSSCCILLHGASASAGRSVSHMPLIWSFCVGSLKFPGRRAIQDFWEGDF